MPVEDYISFLQVGDFWNPSTDGEPSYNSRSCILIKEVILNTLKLIYENLNQFNELPRNQSKKILKNRTLRFGDVDEEFRPLIKILNESKRFIKKYSKAQDKRMTRKALRSVWKTINGGLEQIASNFSIPILTATRNDIDSCWEDDTIDYMEHHPHTCLNIWVDESFESNDFDENSLNHLDSSNIVLFRVVVSRLEQRIDLIESFLRDLKYDGRIRVVLNCEDPVSILQLLRSKPFLRIVPYMVNSAAVKKSEECIGELIKLKGDIVISSKTSDFYKFCNFSTILWINYASDPRREVMEKKVTKTGVIMIRTESTERGLRYLETHSHLGYLEGFRIIIGDGKINENDDTLKDFKTSNKKRLTKPVALSIVPMRRRLNSSKDDFTTTIELVEILRNRLKWMSPILVYYYDSLRENQNLDIYNHHNVKLTDDHSTAEYFALMKPLPWIHDFSKEIVDVTKKGILKVVSIRCSDLLPKKKNMTSDPFVNLKIGKEENKTKKINNTLNPVWNLNWEYKCSLSDKIVAHVWDSELFGRHSEGFISFPNLQMIVPSPTAILEVTRPLMPKGKLDVDGTITFELGFDYIDPLPSNRNYFSLPLAESFERATSNHIPHITEKAIEAIWLNGLKSREIFKMPGNSDIIDALKQKIESGEDVDLATQDPIDVAQLIRMYIRDLPEGIIPNQFYNQFKKTKGISDRKEQIKHLKDLINALPDINRNLLKDLMSLLNEISLNEEDNGMSIKDISNCLGPGLFLSRDSKMKPQVVMEDTQKVTDLLEYMLIQYTKIFGITNKRSMNIDNKKDDSTSNEIVKSTQDQRWLIYEYKMGDVHKDNTSDKQLKTSSDQNDLKAKKYKLNAILELLNYIETLEKEQGMLDDDLLNRKKRLEDEMLLLEEEILLLEDISLESLDCEELVLNQGEMKLNDGKPTNETKIDKKHIEAIDEDSSHEQELENAQNQSDEEISIQKKPIKKNPSAKNNGKEEIDQYESSKSHDSTSKNKKTSKKATTDNENRKSKRTEKKKEV